jgi:hypothetical protein
MRKQEKSTSSGTVQIAKFRAKVLDAQDDKGKEDRSKGGPGMEISPISTNSAMALAARQLSANTALQTTVMKQIAQSQQQLADMLQEIGVGQQVDVRV